MDVSDPATLFNLATLSIHVPPKPLPSPPPSTSLGASDLSGDELEKEFEAVDEWVTALVRADEREEAYYDESLPFYLLLHLPHAPLSRMQATSFLLPSLAPTPHLTLSADLSYVEGSSALPAFTPLAQPPKRRLAGSLSGLSSPTSPPSAPPSASSPTTRGMELGPQVPLTPSPFPSTRPSDAAFVDATGVPVWSYTFEEEGKGKNRDAKFGQGRVWVGKEGGRKGDGAWVGVWEFKGDVSYVKSQLRDPRLCLTITMTFRDDPRLADLLERGSSRRMSVPGAVTDLLAEEDEYLVESFDDVNLLEGLDDTYELHLPASRLPLPVATSRSSLTRRRSSSLSSRRDTVATGAPSHRRSLSLAPSSETLLHPAIRRAFRRVLTVRSALNVRMRTVMCPIYAGRTSNKRYGGAGSGAEEGEKGMALCVEVEGCGLDGDIMGFEIEAVNVEITGGAGAGDVEVKPISSLSLSAPSSFAAALDDEYPIVLSSTDQQNFLYSITYSGQQNDASLFDNAPMPGPLPIAVASSPSTRFTSKMGDQDQQTPSSADAPLKFVGGAGSSWQRNVGIVIMGRPIRLRSEGYRLRDAVTNGATEYASPTATFASRWNCTLDISSFAEPLQTISTAFHPSSLPPQSHSPFPMSALTRLSTISIPTPKRTNLEAVAGSKRHTVSSLASLAIKSPVLSKHRPKPLQLRDLPQASGGWKLSGDGATPGTTGPPRRFFSLPNNGSSPPLTPSRSTTPNNVNPVVPPTPAYPSNSFAPGRQDSGLGLGMGLPSQYSQDRRDSQPSSGDILVSVALMPIRAIKPKVHSFKDSGGDFDWDPPTLEIPESDAPLAHTAHTKRASFQFPGMTSPPLPSLPHEDRIEATRWRTPRIGLLDVFLLEIFVLNRSTDVKRFTIGVPPPKHSPKSTSVATVLALENDVRIGPLQPQSCHSIRMRFVAVRPGAHTIEELRLVDLSNGWETRLKDVVEVVVEG